MALGGIDLNLLVILQATGVYAKSSALGVPGVVAVTSLLITAVFGRRIQVQDAQADRMLLELEATRGAELRAAALAERQRAVEPVLAAVDPGQHQRRQRGLEGAAHQDALIFPVENGVAVSRVDGGQADPQAQLLFHRGQTAARAIIAFIRCP